jgi:hypothetical protein
MARPPRISNWLPWEQESVYFITEEDYRPGDGKKK